jgi:septum site-determining protein MinC
MGKVKPGVTIKGTKNGLLFFLDDSRPFSVVLKELKVILDQQKGSQIWDGPETKVLIKLGQRQITKPEENALRECFSSKKNLVIHSFESEGKPYLTNDKGIQLLAGTVRSGQVLTHTGDLLLLGDINPGGCVQATGSIYVLGALRGLAHAGSEGDGTAVIAASIFKPTQLRIAEVISRPPDEWDESEVGMRLAYLVDNQIAVDQIHHFSQLRPDLEWKEKRKFFHIS